MKLEKFRIISFFVLSEERHTKLYSSLSEPLLNVDITISRES